MDIHFSCTACGKCCHDLKLPLTVAEAAWWLADGNDVQVICEAVPWPTEPRADDLKAAHKRRRSFATMSGSLPTRVIVILAAGFAGACPYLRANMQCSVYSHRPLICRTYPAEINPFIELVPANKACPPEAWTTDRPLLQRAGRMTDNAVRDSIQQSRDADSRDVETKRRLCEALQLDCAAMANEGFVVYSPGRAQLLAELMRLADHLDSATPPAAWRFISNQAATVDALVSLGAIGTLVRQTDVVPFEYLGFKAASSQSV
jgi:Fe-S-cluster containining protein